MQEKNEPWLPTSHHSQTFEMDYKLNVKYKTMKLLGKTVGEYLCDLRVSKYFLDRTQKAATMETDK